jgi:ACR3 family arsenite transporter
VQCGPKQGSLGACPEVLHVTFLEVPFVRIRRAFRNRRFMLAALGTNFLLVPPVAFALTRGLPADSPILVGALLVLLTPCVDYVITFTELAGGDAEGSTATTPALMLVQLLALPLYLRLFVGPEVAAFVEAGPFLEAFAVVVALPPAYALAPAVVVTQTLVELSGMVVLTRVVPRWLVPGD